MNKPVKVKILDMEYDRDNNLFKMKVKDLEKNDMVTFAIKGTDWGIAPDVPQEIVDDFCGNMINKEKNLFIEIDSSSDHVSRNKNGGLTGEGANEMIANLDQYPINEMINNIRSQSHEEEENVD